MSAQCQACGRPLPPNAPAGHCPTCLLEQGIHLLQVTQAKPGVFVPPDLDALARLFPEFELLDFLGQGGMGAVYLARQRDLDRLAAIKILPVEPGTDSEFHERFRREAAVLGSLDHPNIVRLFDFGQRDRFAYFVMEFIDGTDLSKRLREGPLSLEETLGIADQLCDALQHSHERGVVHRDIKPANLLIARDGRLKIADFGLARVMHADSADFGLTRTNTMIGTPRYMAPEQMSGSHTSDHRVDVYAAGVVLYELLTGTVPAGHFDAPSAKRSELNPRLDEVILKALNAHPDDRFRSATELKLGLLDALARPALTPRQRFRLMLRRILLASIGAALLGSVFAVVWAELFSQSRRAPENEPRVVSLFENDMEGRLILLGPRQESWPDLASVPVADVAVAATREEFGLALMNDGQVVAWGDNRFGQTDIPKQLGRVTAVALSQGTRSAHALALRSGGLVVGWGDNTFQQASPPEGLTSIVAVAAGEFFSLALSDRGQVLAWGAPGSAATSFPRNLLPAQAIAAGADFAMALQHNGTVIAWGDNHHGQCQVPELNGAAAGIAAGHAHGLARLEDGRVFAWGDNRAGQCEVPQDLPPVRAVFAGGEGSAAVDSQGKMYAWGNVPEGWRDMEGNILKVAIGHTTWCVLITDH